MEPADIVNEAKKSIAGGDSNRSFGSFSPSFALAMIVGITTLILLIHLGFYHSYIKFFPKFESGSIGAFGPVDFNWIMHVHGMAMMSWVFLLLLQPFLIRKGRKDLHRRLGKLSYAVAPLVAISIYLANYDSFHRNLASLGETQAVATIALTFPGLIYFSLLYGLAIFHKKNTDLHMRFMCSTAFLFIPPALDRTLIYYFNLPGYDVGSNIELTIIAAVVILDSVRTKRVSPFLLVFCFELLHKLLWHSRETEAWQTIGRVIAKLL